MQAVWSDVHMERLLALLSGSPAWVHIELPQELWKMNHTPVIPHTNSIKSSRWSLWTGSTWELVRTVGPGPGPRPAESDTLDTRGAQDLWFNSAPSGSDLIQVWGEIPLQFIFLKYNSRWLQCAARFENFSISFQLYSLCYDILYKGLELLRFSYPQDLP